MKTFIFTTLCLLSLNFNDIKTKSGDIEETTECMLSMRVHPLEFVYLTSTMQFTLSFQSNCKDYLHHGYFVIPFNKFYPLTGKHHPRIVIMQYGGENFTFQYTNNQKSSKYYYYLYLIDRIYEC